MKKIIKKIGVILTILTVCLNSSSSVFCASEVDIPYFIINGEEVVYVGEDYENPETGEYFYWTNSRGVDKTFSFKIRYSVSSSKFTVNGTEVTITASAEVVDEGYYNQTGKIYDDEGFPYTVTLTGIFSRNLKFQVGGTEAGKISGLVDGGTYSISIATGEELPSGLYLEGSGTVRS